MDNAPKEYIVIGNTGEELQNILNKKDSTPSGDYYKTKEKIDNHINDKNIHVTQSDKARWNQKVDKIAGKGLSTNDFTDELLRMVLNGIKEVYIGNTEPTDPNVLIWINPSVNPSYGGGGSNDDETDEPIVNPNTPTITIPNYHYVESGRVTQRLLELKSKYPNHILFGAIADTHIDINNESVKTSANHALFALKSVGLSAQCDFITNLGDNIANSGLYDLNGNLVQSAYDSMVYMESISKDALTSVSSYNLIGNHDKGNSTQELYNFIGKYNHQEGKTSFDDSGLTKIRGYGYKDYEDKKVRVICLNTCDYWDAQGGNGMSYEQKDWFMRSLDLSSKSNFEDWLIIVLSHIPLDFAEGDYNKGDDLKAILSAYNQKNGGDVSIEVDEAHCSAQNESSAVQSYKTYFNGYLTKSYSGINSPKIVNIHGHLHNNIYGKLKFIDDKTELDIVRISTGSSTQDPTAARYEDKGYYSISTEEKNKIVKISGTEKDTSATFYFIDLDNQVVHSIGYGADIDRSISIDVSKKEHDVVYNLTNCSSSTTNNTVIEGSVYTTTIVADSECILSDEVSITMGGIDITNNINSDGTSVYNNGMITIENVTGNIIITAVAIDNYVPTWDIGSRTQKVYSSSIGAGDQKDLSRKFYYVGFAGTGAIHPSYASDVVVEGNNVTFTAYKNVGIGLPMPLEVGATYVFSGEASTTSEGSGKGRLYVNFLNEDGTYISSVNSSSGTNLSIEFTVPENAYWTVLNPVAYQGDNGDTVLNDTVTYTNLILTKQEV